MTVSEDYGIQSVPPRYDETNSFYVHTSDGYRRAVEEIDTEERELAEAVSEAEVQQRLDFEEIEKLEELKREDEKRILEDIRLREDQRQKKIADLEEYSVEEEITPGTNLDLLA